MIAITMEFIDALQKAAQILDEERIRPTVSYEAAPNTEDIVPLMLAMSRQSNLHMERNQRPRRVHESPDEFRFKSTNYELLLGLFSQVLVNDRAAFIASLLRRIPDPASVHRVFTARRFPSWNNFVSELPLVSEFCIRVGYTGDLFRAVGESTLTNGLVLLLMQLEDTVALNFNVFSDDELERLAITLRSVRGIAARKNRKYGPSRALNPEYNREVATIAIETVAVCDGVIEQCSQARYWYLKGALQQNANLEINQDKGRVEDYLKRLGFSDLLLQALNAAEQDFRASATAFELKNSLGHLRSFLEELHQQACSRILAKAGTAAPKGWGNTTKFLRNDGILSEQEKNLAVSLFTLISDVGVHPLIAEREYARLLRNMVVEYGLLCLVKLDKRGVNLSTEEMQREDRSR